MKSLWNDEEAAQYPGALGQRVYTSRLFGRDRTLVLHGGGNTSVKITEKDLFGQDRRVLYVKGSGWDLETIEEAGFCPVDADYLVRLAELPHLSDPAMVNELATHQTRASAPAASVEAILHAILPWTYVDHTHANAVVTITNTEGGEAKIREIYGDDVVVIPYVMPGFDLARACAERFARERTERTQGIVLMNHGIFSFGDTARASYERMIELVGRAEAYLQSRGAWELPRHDEVVPPPAPGLALRLATLRRGVSAAAGAPMLVASRRTAKALAYARHPDVRTITQQGPATPDHVIRTKRLPMLGSAAEDLDAYVAAYRAYFEAHRGRTSAPKTMLDPAPRLIVDPELGLCAVGRSAKDAAIVADIADHTVDIVLRATALGGFRALPAGDIFDVEYWDLEQAKLKKGGKPAVFAGEVALVTGAASGIGNACVHSLLARGAAVVALDIDPAVETMFGRKDVLGIRCDLSREEEIAPAVERGVLAFGGLDMVVLNAGIFPGGCPIASLASSAWRQVMTVNLDANLVLLREAHPLLKLAPGTGRMVIVGSKNVPAPGPGAAAYSASKAALTQLARVAALEWGGDGIRVNVLHPNAVFDTGLWTDEVLAARAKSYGLTVEAYRTNNVLRAEVRSRDVAELAAEMCGPLFARTTAAQVPVDGGNERVI